MKGDVKRNISPSARSREDFSRYPASKCLFVRSRSVSALTVSGAHHDYSFVSLRCAKRRDCFPSLIWLILHQGVRYEERGPAVTKQSKQKRTARMIRQLRNLGYRVELENSQSSNQAGR
jgi:hypothetical protein